MFNSGGRYKMFRHFSPRIGNFLSLQVSHWSTSHHSTGGPGELHCHQSTGWHFPYPKNVQNHVFDPITQWRTNSTSFEISKVSIKRRSKSLQSKPSLKSKVKYLQSLLEFAKKDEYDGGIGQ
ncbi:hypothetical protein L484_005443 [Morus notabilis]|uniref:Uncharacterized protein n=1 Tax=Morus notabilis TaxID=981085 RepID=W9RKB1_9ROSA|nr:hypothetical protein L484_005443 [Morus notabilis]